MNQELEQTSNTKAAIFRRLYEDKSKKLRIKDNESETNKRINLNPKENEEAESSTNEIATYLEEISFLKSQLQDKNKVIVDLQCELIKKSHLKNSSR